MNKELTNNKPELAAAAKNYKTLCTALTEATLLDIMTASTTTAADKLKALDILNKMHAIYTDAGKIEADSNNKAADKEDLAFIATELLQSTKDEKTAAELVKILSKLVK